MRKPRSDSKLLTMPEEHQAALAEWLLSGMPYHVAQERVEKEFGVAVALSAYSDFWTRVCQPALLAKRQRALTTADEVSEQIAKHPGRFDAATIDALKQRAFEFAISPNANPKDVKAVFSLVLKARDQDFDQQQLDLDRDKFQFDAAKACLKALPALKAIAVDNSLDQNGKINAIRQKLFGQLPEVAA